MVSEGDGGLVERGLNFGEKSRRETQLNQFANFALKCGLAVVGEDEQTGLVECRSEWRDDFGVPELCK